MTKTASTRLAAVQGAGRRGAGYPQVALQDLEALVLLQARWHRDRRIHVLCVSSKTKRQCFICAPQQS